MRLCRGSTHSHQAGVVRRPPRGTSLIPQVRIDDDRGISIVVYGRSARRGNRCIFTTPWDISLSGGPHRKSDFGIAILHAEVERRRKRGWRA